MKHVERILPSQLTLSKVGVWCDGAIMLAAGVLEAIQGPIGLQLLFGATQLPEEG